MRSPLASLFVAAIHLYRLISRHFPRDRSCLYSTSCSRHVERVARERGFSEAVAAMRLRFSACRPGYAFEYDDVQWWIVCQDNQRIPAAEASPPLVEEAKACLVPVDAFAGGVRP